MRAASALAALLAVAACHKPGADANGANASAGAAPVANATAPAAGRLDRSHAGQAAPDTAFEDPHGKRVTLAAFRGKPVLVNFWATWCAPCKKELPTLDRLAAEMGDRLRVVAIAGEDTDGRRKVDAYVAAAKFARLEAYLDPKLDVTGKLKVNELPTTILFDAAGREIWRVTADKDWQGAEARGMVAEAFRQAP
jgi:thiol-disulfide isomerase/thioredoxin